MKMGNKFEFITNDSTIAAFRGNTGFHRVVRIFGEYAGATTFRHCFPGFRFIQRDFPTVSVKSRKRQFS